MVHDSSAQPRGGVPGGSSAGRMCVHKASGRERLELRGRLGREFGRGARGTVRGRGQRVVDTDDVVVGAVCDG
jgi:hypothetical protein